MYKSIVLLCLLLISCVSQRELRLYRNVIGNKNPMYFYADEYDNIVFSSRYEDARQYAEGLAAVKQGGKWGFINMAGQTVIPFRYDWCSSFGEYGFDKHIAVIKMDVNKDRIPMLTPCPTALIDANGKQITPFYGFMYPIEHDLSVVNDGKALHNIGRELSAFDGKWGCINSKGKLVVPCEFDLIYPFKDIITFAQKDGKWGVLNETGKLIIPCEFDAGYFKNGYFTMDTVVDTDGRDSVFLQELQEKTIYLVIDDNVAVFNMKGRRIRRL
ncbi:WG repeat-containing protein [Alistipes sp.]|uniref:WG repeat-containing protein n=1 Tax=Alistipes sp. TaxID=1872444 RepID=UPI003AB82987